MKLDIENCMAFKNDKKITLKPENMKLVSLLTYDNKEFISKIKSRVVFYDFANRLCIVFFLLRN